MMEEYFQVLGKISVLYSNLDFFVTLIIHSLVGPNPKIGAIVTDKVASFSARVDLAGSLSEARFVGPQATEFKTLLDRMSAVRNQRNRYMHDLWELNADKLATQGARRYDLRKLAGRSLTIKAETITLIELKAFSEQLAVLVSDVARFYNQMPTDGPKVKLIVDHV